MSVVGKVIYVLYRWRYMDLRERNRLAWSGEHKKFCEDKFIETPIEF